MRRINPLNIFLFFGMLIFAIHLVVIKKHFNPQFGEGSPEQLITPILAGKNGSLMNSIADGCYHVFLDVGSNVGLHGRFLFERDAYPKAKFARKTFDEQFGIERDNRDFCIFAFEPNPAHRLKQIFLQKLYQSHGWKYFAIQQGAGPVDGFVEFRHRDGVNDVGFGALRSGDRTEVVTMVDLAYWLESRIQRRSVPTVVYGNYPAYAEKPRVVMKIDVEGMEFILYRHLIVTGILCRAVDLVFGEFHFKSNFYPLDYRELFNSSLVLNTPAEGKAEHKNIMRMLQTNNECKTRVLDGDDESYAFELYP